MRLSVLPVHPRPSCQEAPQTGAQHIWNVRNSQLCCFAPKRATETQHTKARTGVVYRSVRRKGKGDRDLVPRTMEETSALHTALGLLPPAVVIDSLRYVSARPLPKTTPQDHIRRLVRTRQLFRIAQI